MDARSLAERSPRSLQFIDSSIVMRTRMPRVEEGAGSVVEDFTRECRRRSPAHRSQGGGLRGNWMPSPPGEETTNDFSDNGTG